MLEVNIKKSLTDFKLDVSFNTNNQVVALFGPSGSGKSLTLQCIAGLLKPDDGAIVLNQKTLYEEKSSINLPPQIRKVGFVFQNYALFPHLTVAANIAFGIRGLEREVQRERIVSLIEKVKLKGLEQRYPHQLSGGQQQRVAIARALAIEPEVLLLDEPFSALDSNVKEELEREILEIQQYYQGDILFITHNLAEAYKLSSKIAVYQSGTIIQYDKKEEIITNPVNTKVATMTGMKNLIKGTFEDIKNNRIIVKTELGYINASFAKKASLNKRDEVFLGIRPEYISIIDEPEENTFKIKLKRIVEGVTGCICEFVIGNTEHKHCVYVQIPNTSNNVLKPGKDYFLFFPPEKIATMVN